VFLTSPGICVAVLFSNQEEHYSKVHTFHIIAVTTFQIFALILLALPWSMPTSEVQLLGEKHSAFLDGTDARG